MLFGVDQQPPMWPDHLWTIKSFAKVKFQVDNIHQVSGMILQAYRPTDLQLLVDQPPYSPHHSKTSGSSKKKDKNSKGKGKQKA